MQSIPKEQFLDFAEAYIGEKHGGKYREAFSDMMEGDRLSFNLSAAFWSFMWFFYHKVYDMGFIAMAIFLALDPIVKSVFDTLCILGPGATVIKGLLPIFVSILWVGFYGNWFLYRHVHKQVYRLWRREGQNLPQDVFIERLKRKGGTSIWPIVAVSLIFLLVSVASIFIGFMADPLNMEKILLEQTKITDDVPLHCQGR